MVHLLKQLNCKFGKPKHTKITTTTKSKPPKFSQNYNSHYKTLKIIISISKSPNYSKSKSMAVDQDDFSFPTAALDPFGRCGMDSPPLWRLSPAASPISYRQKSANDRNFTDARFTASLQRRRRFSTDATAADGAETTAAATEKMDALWENFNEDLKRSRRSRLMMKSAEMESVEEVEIVKARRRMAELSMTESSGAVAARRKTTGIVKVLKKLFLIHNNSRRNLQNRSR